MRKLILIAAVVVGVLVIAGCAGLEVRVPIHMSNTAIARGGF